jgi:hypothetical protein
MFKKYMHLERFGNDEVQGIELGLCHIFPKIDGTNASLWSGIGGLLCGGSRTRKLSIEEDNAGFLAAMEKNENIRMFFLEHSELRLYGEWLVPHSLKTYSDEAWRKFYVFDVYSDLTDKYLPYEEYRPMMEDFGIDYIPAMSIIRNSTYDQLMVEIQNNKFLIRDGAGIGEGIVIKNYGYENRFGRLCFAKIVTNLFKEKNQKAFGPTEKNLSKLIEQEIVDKFVDIHFVGKVYAKIVNEMGGWNSKQIPRLLNTVYHDLVSEEIWDIVKKMKNPTINFRTLNQLVILKIKELRPELF